MLYSFFLNAINIFFIQSGLLEEKCTTKDFDIGVTLGTGSFGRVRFATHRKSGRPCAIKMLKKAAIIRFQQVSLIFMWCFHMHFVSNSIAKTII